MIFSRIYYQSSDKNRNLEKKYRVLKSIHIEKYKYSSRKTLQLVLRAHVPERISVRGQVRGFVRQGDHVAAREGAHSEQNTRFQLLLRIRSNQQVFAHLQRLHSR